VTALKTITTAEPSVGPPPMPIHLVRVVDDDWPKDKPVPLDDKNPREVTLCGRPWDRLGRSDADRAPLCDACADEFIRRHGFRHELDRRAS
jgi:hypothetical protein